MGSLSGVTLSPQESLIPRSSSARGEASWAPPMSMLGFWPAWSWQTLPKQAQLLWAHVCRHAQQVLFWGRQPLSLDLTAFWLLHVAETYNQPALLSVDTKCGDTRCRLFMAVCVSLETEWLPSTLPWWQAPRISLPFHSQTHPSLFLLQFQVRAQRPCCPKLMSPPRRLPSSQPLSAISITWESQFLSITRQTVEIDCGFFFIFTSVLQCYVHYLDKCLQIIMPLSYGVIISIFIHS